MRPLRELLPFEYSTRNIAWTIGFTAAGMFLVYGLIGKGALQDAWRTHGRENSQSEGSSSEEEKPGVSAGLYINGKLYRPGPQRMHYYQGALGDVAFDFRISTKPENIESVLLKVGDAELGVTFSLKDSETRGNATWRDMRSRRNQQYPVHFRVDYKDGTPTTVTVLITPRENDAKSTP